MRPHGANTRAPARPRGERRLGLPAEAASPTPRARSGRVGAGGALVAEVGPHHLAVADAEPLVGVALEVDEGVGASLVGRAAAGAVGVAAGVVGSDLDGLAAGLHADGVQPQVL